MVKKTKTRTPKVKSSPPAKGESRGLPTREQILEFIESADEKVGKREIARAFGIRGDDRVGLKALLGEMSRDGALTGSRKAMKRPGRLKPVGVLEIVDRDAEGDLVAVPVGWMPDEGPTPRVLVPLRSDRMAAMEGGLGPGDRILARIAPLDDDESGYRHRAEPIKKLPREKIRLLGIFRERAKGGGSIDPINRREMKTWPVPAGSEGEAKDGDLVRFDILSRHGRGLPEARVAEVLGNPSDQRQISLIAVHAHGIPDVFPDVVLREVAALPALEPGGRLDLTGLPLITIDPIDARDHDDAVHARPDTDTRNPGGFVVTVAIADVAHYVRPGTRLDREAELRGNSVYFPDRVVPMLPERISNDLCSLREGEARPCLAVEMIFDANGRKRRHTFHRALMRSAAKLSYQEAQAAIDGTAVSEKCGPLLESVLQPLWAAYRCLLKGRAEREPLDLDLPERKILMDEHGRVRDVIVPERLDAHRLIEEMMIQANVAAAETLEQNRTPVVYRIHDRPGKEKLAALRDFLASLDLSIPKGEGLKPADFNRVLMRAKTLPVADLVSEVVLRAQAQAEYNTQNIGHFGLNLQRYAHFTSPIRRYADLLVHRALIRALRLGEDGLPKEGDGRLSVVARGISETERRAMAAERETSDRLLAAYLADRVGADFPARVSGVTRSGLFVRLKGTGADGFVPAASIGGDYWRHDEERHALVGDRTGLGFRLGDQVEVRLVEAVPAAGAMRFELLSEGMPMGSGGARRHRGLRAKRRTYGRR